MQFQQYSNVLDELGYFPLSSKAEEILYDVAKKSIERLGESASKALLDHICSINELSEKELLTNYDLFEKSLYRVLRKGAAVILQYLKRELLVHAVLIDQNITISDIRNPRLRTRLLIEQGRYDDAVKQDNDISNAIKGLKTSTTIFCLYKSIPEDLEDRLSEYHDLVIKRAFKSTSTSSLH